MREGTHVLVRTASDDAEGLRHLIDALGDTHQPTQTEGLLGETLVQCVLIVTPAVVSVLKTWLEAHASRHVIWDGTEFRGYSSREITALVEALTKQADGGESEPQT